jgi:hypothetical protein
MTETYRMDGGVPAGMLRSSLESGDRANSVRITMTTRHGNSRTKASGTEKDESPVRRTRRLKNPVRGGAFSVRRVTSSGFCKPSLAFGSRLVTSWKGAMF